MISRSKILCVVSQEALHKIQVVQLTSYKWYLQVVSFQQSSDVHKKCKIQASTIYPKMHTFASMRSTPFMEIDDKEGEIVQRYERFEIKIVQGGEIRYESCRRD